MEPQQEIVQANRSLYLHHTYLWHIFVFFVIFECLATFLTSLPFLGFQFGQHHRTALWGMFHPLGLPVCDCGPIFLYQVLLKFYLQTYKLVRSSRLRNYYAVCVVKWFHVRLQICDCPYQRQRAVVLPCVRNTYQRQYCILIIYQIFNRMDLG